MGEFLLIQTIYPASPSRNIYHKLRILYPTVLFYRNLKFHIFTQFSHLRMLHLTRPWSWPMSYGRSWTPNNFLGPHHDTWQHHSRYICQRCHSYYPSRINCSHQYLWICKLCIFTWFLKVKEHFFRKVIRKCLKLDNIRSSAVVLHNYIKSNHVCYKHILFI